MFWEIFYFYLSVQCTLYNELINDLDTCTKYLTTHKYEKKKKKKKEIMCTDK